MVETEIDIIDYKDSHQPYFEKLNREWIEKHFWLEEIDRYVLENPVEAIITPGGAILMAICEDEVVGTVALKKIDTGTYEFTKMAVDPLYRGKGIGEALSYAAIKKAWALGADCILLYSQTGLIPAITMYKKIGFVEVPLEAGVYKRSDIKMELKKGDGEW